MDQPFGQAFPAYSRRVLAALAKSISASKLHYVPGPVSFGRRVASIDAAPLYFSGALDELAIYGSDLTADAVLQLYSVSE